MTKKRAYHEASTLFMIALGTAIYALGVVAINIQNNLAEGGLTGVTLILRYWLHIDPALSTLVLNIPLILLGYRSMGKKALFYTVWGTGSLALFLFVWQRIPIISQLNLEHDLFIAAVLAGLIGGFGAGIVFKFGGTTGGTDIIARILELKLNLPIGRTLLAVDFLVLTASLSYLNIKQMMYTLFASFVFSNVVNFTQEGSYSAKGVLIISNKYEQIGRLIDLKLDRGYTYLMAEGGYQNDEKKIIYSVVSRAEIPALKDLILTEDPNAFISIIEVHEVFGEGFSQNKKKTRLFTRK